MLSHHFAASGTVDVETIRMIFPTADFGAFFGEDIATAAASIIVVMRMQPTKKPL